MQLIWERLKVLTEASSAIALAPLLKRDVIESICRSGPLTRKPKIGIILSGGNIDLRALPFH
jgi:threonine dehydratase